MLLVLLLVPSYFMTTKPPGPLAGTNIGDKCGLILARLLRLRLLVLVLIIRPSVVIMAVLRFLMRRTGLRLCGPSLGSGKTVHFEKDTSSYRIGGRRRNGSMFLLASQN